MLVPSLLACDSELDGEHTRAAELPTITSKPAALLGEGVALAQPCEWPTAVALGSGGCSGVLIHPQVVMTAAHCIGGNGPAEIRFGEQVDTPARTVATTGCAKNPAAMGVSVDDYAYCVLTEPVDLPIAPPLMGCELDSLAIGDAFVTVGWGNGDGGGGIKRYVATEFIGFNQGMISASTTPAEACSGDSGGPTFVQLPDGSWRTVGVSSGGPAGQNPGCINPVLVVPAAAAAAWIEAETGIDVTPCTLGDGSWDPSPACTGFALAPDLGGEWMAETCAGELSGAASTCGPSVDQGPESDAPTVEILFPEDGAVFPGPEANLDIEVLTDDGEGVAVLAVELFVDGGSAAEKVVEWPLQAPSSWIFEGAVFPEGEYTLSATATDWWGNVGESAPVAFVVGDPPSSEGDGDGDPGDGDGDPGDGDGDPGDGDSGTGESGSGLDESDTGGETGGAADAGLDEGSGCACDAGRPRGSGWPWVLLLLPLLRVRRRAV